MASASLIQLAYLIAAVLFISGLKGLTHPRTAVRGNLLGALGMGLAMVAVLLDVRVISFSELSIGLAIGAVIGITVAVKVEMTSMPQLVAIFNGLGGAASWLVAASEYVHELPQIVQAPVGAHAAVSVSIGAAALIGAVTLTGSIIAFLKLAELVPSRAIRVPGGVAANLILVLFCLALIVGMVMNPNLMYLWLLIGAGSLLGITLTIPIGGADMPVVIALMNSYSGIAAAAAGFALQNNALIIAGSLVGSSGIILTAIMCKAMNRSLTNVLFGAMGATASGPSADDVYGGKIKQTSGDEIAMLLDGVSRVVIIPGYGMAVAQAQHAVRDLMNVLEARDVQVEFAIHPVAGRMPGHMNVLLAESDVPYDKLIEMDEINPTMPEVDIAIVIGANDTVNPAAKTDPDSPLAGMPIIDADAAQTVIVIKRSLSPGFAKVPNPLFAADNTLMFFSDGKQAMIDINEALKDL